MYHQRQVSSLGKQTSCSVPWVATSRAAWDVLYLLFCFSSSLMGQIVTWCYYAMVWHCWCTHYGFLHISLKPHSSPVPWFPVSMEVWASNYTWHLKAWATAFDLYKLEAALCSGKAYVNTPPRNWNSYIFPIHVSRSHFYLYMLEKSFLHEVTYHSQVGRSPLWQGNGEDIRG